MTVSNQASLDDFRELSLTLPVPFKLEMTCFWPILTMVVDHGCWPKYCQNEIFKFFLDIFESAAIWRSRGASMGPKSSVQTRVMIILQIVPFTNKSKWSVYTFKHTTHCKKNCMQFAVYRTLLHAVCSLLQVILHDAVQKTRYITYRTTPGVKCLVFEVCWQYPCTDKPLPKCNNEDHIRFYRRRVSKSLTCFRLVRDESGVWSFLILQVPPNDRSVRCLSI